MCILQTQLLFKKNSNKKKLLKMKNVKSKIKNNANYSMALLKI